MLNGFMPLSMVDYPGKPSVVFFTGGCNFKCPYCHNPALIGGSNDEEGFPTFSLREAIKKIEESLPVTEGVVITGGEPTIHGRQLTQFCMLLKEFDYPIKLDTNGTNPELTEHLIKLKLVDYVAMDIKTSWGKYHLCSQKNDIEEIKKTAHILVEQGDLYNGFNYEFRTTVVPGIVDEKDIESIALWLYDIGAKEYFLQQFSNEGVRNETYSQKTPYSKKQLDKMWETANQILCRDMPTGRSVGVRY